MTEKKSGWGSKDPDEVPITPMEELGDKRGDICDSIASIEAVETIRRIWNEIAEHKGTAQDVFLTVSLMLGCLLKGVFGAVDAADKLHQGNFEGMREVLKHLNELLDSMEKDFAPSLTTSPGSPDDALHVNARDAARILSDGIEEIMTEYNKKYGDSKP